MERKVQVSNIILEGNRRSHDFLTENHAAYVSSLEQLDIDSGNQGVPWESARVRNATNTLEEDKYVVADSKEAPEGNTYLSNELDVSDSGHGTTDESSSVGNIEGAMSRTVRPKDQKHELIRLKETVKQQDARIQELEKEEWSQRITIKHLQDIVRKLEATNEQSLSFDIKVYKMEEVTKLIASIESKICEYGRLSRSLGEKPKESHQSYECMQLDLNTLREDNAELKRRIQAMTKEGACQFKPIDNCEPNAQGIQSQDASMDLFGRKLVDLELKLKAFGEVLDKALIKNQPPGCNMRKPLRATPVEKVGMSSDSDSPPSSLDECIAGSVCPHETS